MFYYPPSRTEAVRIMMVAILAFICGHAADIVSTVLCMAYVPGSIETHQFMRDPVTLKFVLTAGLKMKALGFLCYHLPVITAIYAATRSWFLASLVFWYEIPAMYLVVTKNLAMLMFWGNL